KGLPLESPAPGRGTCSSATPATLRGLDAASYDCFVLIRGHSYRTDGPALVLVVVPGDQAFSAVNPLLEVFGEPELGLLRVEPIASGTKEGLSHFTRVSRFGAGRSRKCWVACRRT